MMLNAAGIAIASAGLLVALSPLVDQIPDGWPILAGIFVATALMGYPFGYAAAKMCCRSRLAGAILLLPLAAMLALAQVTAFLTVTALRGHAPELPLVVVLAGIGFWSITSACRKLLRD